KIADLSLKTNAGLTFLYDSSQDEFEMYGDLQATFRTTTIDLTLGNATTPGLLIQQGNLKQLVCSVSGQVSVYGLTIDASPSNPPTLTYSDTDTFTLSGAFDVLFTSQFKVSVSLGTQANPGIVVQNGDFKLDNLQVELDNLDYGIFTLHDFLLAYSG